MALRLTRPGRIRLGAFLCVLACCLTLEQAQAQPSPPDAGITPDASVAPTSETEPSSPVPEPDAQPPAPPTAAEVATDLGPAAVAEAREPIASGAAPIRYRLEAVQVRGNRTRAAVITSFVPLKTGVLFDVEDPSIEEIRWRLLGTGWFNDVKLSLTRGSQRGWVVLLIEVKERNTLLVEQFAMGLSRAVTDKPIAN